MNDAIYLDDMEPWKDYKKGMTCPCLTRVSGRADEDKAEMSMCFRTLQWQTLALRCRLRYLYTQESLGYYKSGVQVLVLTRYSNESFKSSRPSPNPVKPGGPPNSPSTRARRHPHPNSPISSNNSRPRFLFLTAQKLSRVNRLIDPVAAHS